MRIRLFKKNDAIILSKLIIGSIIATNSEFYSKDVIDVICSKYTPEIIIKNSLSRKILVAYNAESKTILGTISVENDYINSCYVDKNLLRKGIGTKLVKKALFIIKKNGFSTVKLHSTQNALEFYTKSGFIVDKIVESKKYGKNYFMILKF